MQEHQQCSCQQKADNNCRIRIGILQRLMMSLWLLFCDTKTFASDYDDGDIHTNIHTRCFWKRLIEIQISITGLLFLEQFMNNFLVSSFNVFQAVFFQWSLYYIVFVIKQSHILSFIFSLFSWYFGYWTFVPCLVVRYNGVASKLNFDIIYFILLCEISMSLYVLFSLFFFYFFCILDMCIPFHNVLF